MRVVRRACARAAVWCCVWVGIGGVSQAQTAITVDEAVHEAVDRNLTLLAERYSVSVAQARILAAQLRPNPVFTYNLMLPDAQIYDNNINPRENVFRTDVIIEGGGKRERRIAVAEQARSVAELQLLNTMRTIALDVQSACVDVVLAKENLALALASLAAFNDLVRVNTERVRTGDLASVELSRSRLAALQFQNDLRQQQTKLVVARNRLRTLLGRTGGDPIDVSGDFRRDDERLDAATLRTRALQRRPDVEAMRADQARSTADIRLQLAQGKIDYTISGEFHRQQAPATTGNQIGVYLSLPMPIFNRNQGEIERARQEEKQIEAKIRALEADVLNEVQTAYETYAASRDIVDTLEGQMLAQARDVRTATQYSYLRGEASFIEFLDAFRAYNETMQSYNVARADYARSLYTLDATTGASIANLKVTP
jgi:outer membrane protein, heavy metal efflux system